MRPILPSLRSNVVRIPYGPFEAAPLSGSGLVERVRRAKRAVSERTVARRWHAAGRPSALLLRGRPGKPLVIPERVLRHVHLPAPVGVHDVDLVVAVAVTHEGDLVTVGRPASVILAFHQPALSAPVSVHHPHVAVLFGKPTLRPYEEDLLAVRR